MVLKIKIKHQIILAHLLAMIWTTFWSHVTQVIKCWWARRLYSAFSFAISRRSLSFLLLTMKAWTVILASSACLQILCSLILSRCWITARRRRFNSFCSFWRSFSCCAKNFWWYFLFLWRETEQYLTSWHNHWLCLQNQMDQQLRLTLKSSDDTPLAWHWIKPLPPRQIINGHPYLSRYVTPLIEVCLCQGARFQNDERRRLCSH